MDSDSEYFSSEEDFLTLDQLPPEVFLHICSFLRAKFVINILSKVCRKFHDLIENDGTWRTRLFRRWPKRYPIIPDIVSDWKDAYVVREENYDLWTNNGEKMKTHHIKDAHFGSVNIVHLLEDGRICASGGRDGSLKLWNISHIKEEFNPSDSSSHILHSKFSAHGNAWLWSLAYDGKNQMLYSGGFDGNIKAWDISDPSIPITSYSLATPVVSLAFHNQSLASGCYGKSVNLFDPRSGPICHHIHHRRPVICIALDDKYIISGSEDKSVIVFDRVASRVLTTLMFDGFPLSMSYDSQQLFVGDVLGNFHVIDPSDGFRLLQSYESGHKMKVTGIHHSLGSLITCSTDKTIRILEPNAEPDPIAVIQTTSEVSKISCFQTTLVSANTDDSMYVWLPEEDCS